ncbi:hypothetical protein B0H14DRAFT_3528821 [Mycena olivaceomarginata]|nr:hypothetical protein B0H14DRAFT_3528821 [Mycena olivaceomarginata]
MPHQTRETGYPRRHGPGTHPLPRRRRRRPLLGAPPEGLRADDKRRVDTNMRSLVRFAVPVLRAAQERRCSLRVLSIILRSHQLQIQSALIKIERTRRIFASKSKPAASADATPPIHVEKHASRPKEFARTFAAPRRLKDIAPAPPELSSFARKKSANPILSLSGNNKTTGTPAGEASILSPAQQLAMAVAREDAVRSYRALKAPGLVLFAYAPQWRLASTFPILDLGDAIQEREGLPNS